MHCASNAQCTDFRDSMGRVGIESSFKLHRFEREWDLGSVGHNDHVYIYILGNIGYLFEVNSHITYAPISLTSSTSE